MGLAYTIDTPAKVARFGISSVVSIIEDTLIERMRKYYYRKTNRPYFPINITEPDYRAKRITDYLNLLNEMVNEQIEKLKESGLLFQDEIKARSYLKNINFYRLKGYIYPFQTTS